MKFLHTSDWHLGMILNNGKSYADDQRAFINEISTIAVNNKVDGILIAGDIFDKAIASAEALNLYDEAMTLIVGKLKIPVYLIAGNHDGAQRLSSCNRLLEQSGLYITGTLSRVPQCINVKDVDIYMCPWITTDRVRAAFPEKAEEIQGIQEAYKVVMDEYRRSFDNSHKKILVTHAFIADAETSTSDRAAQIGNATMVSADVFDGFDYVALGHLHGPQQITDTIRYSGTPMAYSFGKEEKQEKSVTIYDTESDSIEIVPLHSYRKRTTLSGTYEELRAGKYSEDIRNGYVRLEVSDCYLGLEVCSSLREIYPNLLEISGKSLEKDDAKITMTIEELEDDSMNPETVFIKYCEDMLEELPDEHIIELFRKAIKAYEEEAAEE